MRDKSNINLICETEIQIEPTLFEKFILNAKHL